MIKKKSTIEYVEISNDTRNCFRENNKNSYGVLIAIQKNKGVGSYKIKSSINMLR